MPMAYPVISEQAEDMQEKYLREESSKYFSKITLLSTSKASSECLLDSELHKSCEQCEECPEKKEKECQNET